MHHQGFPDLGLEDPSGARDLPRRAPTRYPSVVSSSMGPLSGKRALVCGATQGIGRACAFEFARLGARVTLLARNEEDLRRARDELAAAEGAQTGRGAPRHDFLRADFAEPDSVRAVVARHVEKAGPVEVLLNNTGGPQAGPIVEADPEAFLAGFSAHLICNQVLARTLLPGMKAAGYGRIINIVSTSVKQPIRGLGVSNTIRGAVASWAKTLAGELAPFGITVNNVLPGATATGRLRSFIRSKARAAGISEDEVERQMKSEIPMGRFAGPEEIAAAAGFLATPAAGYITGISLPVDGGRTSCL
jgi:3-oxoacyl-[acyl-carrier protein] reductase